MNIIRGNVMWAKRIIPTDCQVYCTQLDVGSFVDSEQHQKLAVGDEKFQNVPKC